MNKLLGELLGWYGAAAIITAYVLVSFSIMNSSSLAFQLLNLTGAIGILAISLAKKVYQTAAINIIWAIVAAAAIVRMML